MGRAARPKPLLPDALGADLARRFAGAAITSVAACASRSASGVRARPMAFSYSRMTSAGWSAASISAMCAGASPRRHRSATGWASPLPARD